MPCGCTDNKNLNKDELSLESMQTLSIDEIINLYRHGYTLEESESFTSIRSLATKAYPNIEGTTARYNGSSTIPMLLYSNSGSYGYVHLEAYTAPSTVISEIKECASVTTSLYKLAVFPAVSGAVYDIMFRAKACDTFATETCTTCTSETQTGNWTIGAYPGANVTTPPPTPTGLTITPGDSYLVLSWNSVADPIGSGEVFAYKVTVTGPNGITGYRPSGSPGRTVTISGLTNGTSYSISVKSLSHNNVESTGAATGSGTPSLPTPVLTSISPASADIQTNTNQQFTAIDNNGNVIATGVTWTKTAGVGSIGATTGLYSAGPTAGTATISATYGGVTKTTSITVTTTPPTIVLTSISPASATIQINTTKQFTAKDQNTNTIATGVTWTKTAGVGSINSTGLYSAGPTAGTATISATYGGVTKTAQITVTTTQPPQAGGGGAIMIAAVAAIGIAYFMMRKPPTKP